MCVCVSFFFFSSRRRHTRYWRDWSSDVCSSDLPVVITVYADRSFTFETKTPPAADLLKKAAGIPKGSGKPNREKVGTISRDKIEEIARQKMPDRSEEHTSELQSRQYLVCRLLLEKKQTPRHLTRRV